MTKPTNLESREFNDDPERELIHPLYREGIRPDFEQAHRKAIEAIEWLKEHYFPKSP